MFLPLANVEMFDACVCPGVAEGICVMVRSNQIVYAGEIANCPEVPGSLLLLHQSDFGTLAHHFSKRRH